MTNKTCLIFCNCGAGIISDDKKDELSEAFKPLGVDIYELHDLCAFSLNEKDFLHEFNKDYDKKLIAACYPRAIKNMFEQNKVQLSNYEVFNFREARTEQITADISVKIDEKQEESFYNIKETELKAPAWYPIIDKERCTLCGQCARFCVFGVYAYNKKKSGSCQSAILQKQLPGLRANLPGFGNYLPAFTGEFSFIRSRTNRG